MKRPFLISLGVLVLVITGALIFASVKSAQKYRFGVTAEELHARLIESNHMIAPGKALEIVRANDQSYIFVDLRNPRSYANYHIEGAVNIPMQRILDEQYRDLLKADRKKILYSDEGISANEVWMILTQYGFDNLLVLDGGLDYWLDNVADKNVFELKGGTGAYSDEQPKYDFQKVMESAESESEEQES